MLKLKKLFTESNSKLRCSTFFCLVMFSFSSVWGESALEQLNSDTPFKTSKINQLSILVYPAGTKLNWQTPGKLVRSVVWNTLKGQIQPIAHMDIFLRCEGKKPLLTGMSRQKTWKTYEDILFRRASLGLLTARFPGYLFSETAVMGYLKPAIATGKVRALSFELNSESCLRLQEYYDEYVKRGYEKQYSGFTSNPYLGEGAGCAAFAVSFLQVAGLLDPYIHKSWSRELSVPLRLLPEGGSPPTFWGYMFGIEEAWASVDEKSLSVIIYDPEKIYDWVYDQTNERHISPLRSKLLLVEKAIELVVDSRDVKKSDNYWLYSWPPVELAQ